MTTSSEVTDTSVGKTTTNNMGGINFVLSPFQQLMVLATTSLFGQSKYYDQKTKNPTQTLKCIRENSKYTKEMSIITEVTDLETIFSKCLSEDFEKTLKFLPVLRNKYFIRENTAILFVLAAIHTARPSFNKANPGVMREIGKQIIVRPDDVFKMFSHYKAKRGSKKKLPGILKRIWKSRIEAMSEYQFYKYKTGAHLVDMVRIVHAKGPLVNKLMKNQLKAEQSSSTGSKKIINTWENLKSQGKTWLEILDTVKLGHMALLRNLRGIFTELRCEENKISHSVQAISSSSESSATIEGTDVETKDQKLEKLKKKAQNILKWLRNGVKYGKQFPFRYYSTYEQLEIATDLYQNEMVLQALEDCIDLSVSNVKALKGRSLVLADVSGSMGIPISDKSSTTMRVIAVLGGLISSKLSESSTFGIFGDKISYLAVNSETKILETLNVCLNELAPKIGYDTENGIWLALDKAIKDGEKYDNIIIYSDQQAGHGGLYGQGHVPIEYLDAYRGITPYINVMKMITMYRTQVNPKCNVYSVSMAGYKNGIFPELFYRGALLFGWTGQEINMMSTYNYLWDKFEGIATKTPIPVATTSESSVVNPDEPVASSSSLETPGEHSRTPIPFKHVTQPGESP